MLKLYWYIFVLNVTWLPDWWNGCTTNYVCHPHILTFCTYVFHIDLWLKTLVFPIICIYRSCFWEIFHCIYTNFVSILHNKIINLKTCTLKKIIQYVLSSYAISSNSIHIIIVTSNPFYLANVSLLYSWITYFYFNPKTIIPCSKNTL